MIKAITLLNRFQITKSLSRNVRQETETGKDKFRKFHKSGP